MKKSILSLLLVMTLLCGMFVAVPAVYADPEVAAIPNAEIKNDDLNWDRYLGANKYTVIIDGDWKYETNNTTTVHFSLGLNGVVENFVKYNRYPASGTLPILIQAHNDTTLLAESALTYNYTTNATPEKLEEIKDVQISSDGIMTWSAFEYTTYYIIYIDKNRINLTDETTYNLKAKINDLISSGKISDSGEHKIILDARGALGWYNIATWSTDYQYFKSPCTISFDANGGSGTMKAETVGKGEKYTLPACTFTAPDGKEFDTWDKGAPGAEITVSKDTVIKAQWKDKPAPQEPADQPQQDQPQQDQPQQDQEQESDERIVFSKLKKVKLKAVSKKKIKVSWKKLSKKVRKEVKKIQIQVSTDPNFQTIVKTKLVSSKKKSYTISGLKKGTKYYIRIRAYTEKDGLKYVSEWSVKNKKTKKK